MWMRVWEATGKEGAEEMGSGRKRDVWKNSWTGNEVLKGKGWKGN